MSRHTVYPWEPGDIIRANLTLTLTPWTRDKVAAVFRECPGMCCAAWAEYGIHLVRVVQAEPNTRVDRDMPFEQDGETLTMSVSVWHERHYSVVTWWGEHFVVPASDTHPIGTRWPMTVQHVATSVADETLEFAVLEARYAATEGR